MKISWYQDIFHWYQNGFWSEAMVENAVAKQKITAEEKARILSGEEGESS